jgi:hypothetical protein
MKSHKIQGLELVSYQIEGRDSKRKVVHISFGHPTKKTELGCGSPCETAMAGLELHGRRPWGLAGEDGRGKGWGEGGAATGGARIGACGGAVWGGLSHAAHARLFWAVGEEEGKKREKEKSEKVKKK